MRKLTLETATVRIAAFPHGGRLLTVRATCFGPAAACTSARLVPRRHADAPEDGLWDIDLVCNPAPLGEDAGIWRDVVFTGEADWCEGVRLHSPGGVLEHRMDPQAPGRPPRPDRAAPRPPKAVARTPTPPPPGPRSRIDLFRVAMDGVAAAMLLAGLALLPMALPANAAEPGRASAAAVTADHPEAGRCQHRSLLAYLS